MDCIVHGVTKNRTQLSNFHFPSFPLNILSVELLPRFHTRTAALLALLIEGIMGHL